MIAINHFTVTFTRTQLSGPSIKAEHADEPQPLTGRAGEVLALFAGGSELTASYIAQATGLGKAMAQRYLARLVAEGQLTATAPPASRNRAYRLPNNPEGD